MSSLIINIMDSKQFMKTEYANKFLISVLKNLTVYNVKIF